MKPSGIGGQAVIEGIMMRNKDQYSIAVRKPDNEIEVTVRDCNQLQKKHPWLNYPIIRGVYSLLNSEWRMLSRLVSYLVKKHNFGGMFL